MDQAFDGKVVVVTGASSGIGAATARAFLDEGARVVAADIAEPRAEPLVDRSAAGDLLYVRCDVRSGEEVAAMVQAGVERFGGIDVLYNGAGVWDAGDLPSFAEAQWDRVLGVNVRGTYLACRHAIPHMLVRGGGAIVNTASTHAHLTRAGHAAYAASKAAVLGLTRAVALDHAREGIRCNAVAPGPVDTPTFRAVLQTRAEKPTEEALADVAQAQPLGRIGRPEDIAAAVLFLASDKAAFVNGATFSVDGGLHV